jgi:ABC-type Mn2+/Zn2+ transport system ATPase subunit
MLQAISIWAYCEGFVAGIFKLSATLFDNLSKANGLTILLIMTSTTTTKKEIVDFLWEWAETNGDWSKLLISKIVSTETDLTSLDRQTVFNYFLQSIGLYKGLPPLAIVKPVYTPTSKQIELTSLSDVTGVNRLAKNQTINFSKNLTVIFGENGTGKTGYGRILKSLGFSYDSNNKILSNIFGTAAAKTATIKYKSNGVDEPPFNWNGANKNSELENISVFNNNCVQISLSDRQLIVSPIGFHLFNIVTSELSELAKLLNTQLTTYPTALPWAVSLTPGTAQHSYITALSTASTEAKLIELSTFETKHEDALKLYESELENLNKGLIQSEIQNLTLAHSELVSIISKIQNAQTKLNPTNWQALLDLNKEIKELESKTQTGIKEIAEINGIAFYETEQFQLFIKAAENYVKTIGKAEYPSEKDNCIYCLQPLDASAKDLLSCYRLLLNDKTEENLQLLKKKKASLIQEVSLIDVSLSFNQTTFGVDNEQKPIQPTEINQYNISLGEFKTMFISDKIDEGSVFKVDYDGYIKFLWAKKEAINTTLVSKQALLLNLGDKEVELKGKISELKDRKLLSTKVSDLKSAIKNHTIVATLSSNVGSFNSYSISRKTTEARDVLVKSNFDTLFKSELKAFRKAHINIDLNFGTDRGNSKVTHRIMAHSLIDILSEGEQKAIALAEFLTELQLDNIKAPVIFDDPVNSLDHNIIDDVARRLLKLSNERQVVIFTHSVLLFNSLLYFCKQPTYKGILTKFYNSKNEFDETGFITEAEEEKNSVKDYLSKINVIINNTPKDRPEVEIAEDGYGCLRSAIELFVEHEIFQGTVKRYQKNISLTQFVKVNGALVNAHKDKLNEIFERCCGFIKGHSNPTEIHNDPTIVELKADFEDFKAIREAFPKN